MSLPRTPVSQAVTPIQRSRTRFVFSDTHRSRILQASAYHRKDFDHAVISFPRDEHRSVASAFTSASRSPGVSVGELERLPLEIINKICLELDTESLFAFRQTNLRARDIVNSMTEFRKVATHALGCLCALLRTRTARYVTLADFFKRLCESKCAFCEVRHGSFIHLPTWVRCCISCMYHASSMHMVTAASVKRVLGLPKRQLDKLPSIVTLPGVYSLEETSCTRRIKCVLLKSVVTAYRDQHSGRDALEPTLCRLVAPRLGCFRFCCVLPTYHQKIADVEWGISCAGCQLAVEGHIDNSVLESAFELRDTAYTQDDFLKHFEWCEPAQRLWLSSEYGTREPEQLPQVCKAGGSFNKEYTS